MAKDKQASLTISNRSTQSQMKDKEHGRSSRAMPHTSGNQSASLWVSMTMMVMFFSLLWQRSYDVGGTGYISGNNNAKVDGLALDNAHATQQSAMLSAFPVFLAALAYQQQLGSSASISTGVGASMLSLVSGVMGQDPSGASTLRKSNQLITNNPLLSARQSTPAFDMATSDSSIMMVWFNNNDKAYVKVTGLSGDVIKPEAEIPMVAETFDAKVIYSPAAQEFIVVVSVCMPSQKTFFQRYRPDGTAVGEVGLISNQCFRGADAAPLKDGGFVVVYQDSLNYMARFFDSAGQPLTDVFTVAEASSRNTLLALPVIHAFSSGEIGIICKNKSSGQEVTMRIYSEKGVFLWETSEMPYTAATCAITDENFISVNKDTRPSGTDRSNGVDIYSLTIDKLASPSLKIGANSTIDYILEPEPSQVVYALEKAPTMVRLTSGDCQIAYSRFNSAGSTYDLLSASYNSANGHFGQAEKLVLQATSGSMVTVSPIIRSLPENGYVVAYISGTDNGWNLYASVYDYRDPSSIMTFTPAVPALTVSLPTDIGGGTSSKVMQQSTVEANGSTHSGASTASASSSESGSAKPKVSASVVGAAMGMALLGLYGARKNQQSRSVQVLLQADNVDDATNQATLVRKLA